MVRIPLVSPHAAAAAGWCQHAGVKTGVRTPLVLPHAAAAEARPAAPRSRSPGRVSDTVRVSVRDMVTVMVRGMVRDMVRAMVRTAALALTRRPIRRARVDSGLGLEE